MGHVICSVILELEIIDFCEQNDLVIGGTLFQHKTIHKLTWTCHRSFSSSYRTFGKKRQPQRPGIVAPSSSCQRREDLGILGNAKIGEASPYSLSHQ